MGMRSILIIGDPLAVLKPSSDSSLAIAQGALESGFSVYWCEPKDIAIHGHAVVVQSLTQLLRVSSVRVQEKNGTETKQGKLKHLREFEAIFIRKDPPFDSDYISMCWMLSLNTSVRIINPPRRLLEFHEKIPQFRALMDGYIRPQNVVPSYVGRSPEICQEFLKEHKVTEVIVKPWLGFGGRSIHHFSDAAKAIAFLKENRNPLWIVQPFLPEIFTQGDRRVVMVRGDVFCSFVRTPARGHVASNLAQGGSASLVPLTHPQQKLLDAVGSFLKYYDLDFAGVDLIGETIGEINITSPTGVRTYEQLAQTPLCQNLFQRLMGAHF